MSPIFTIPCGWWVLKAIGISATGCQRTARVSFWMRSATTSFAAADAAGERCHHPEDSSHGPSCRYNAPAPI